MQINKSNIPSQTEEEAENSEENIEIIRSIASYLSLSEVESLGSLYSLVSPPSSSQQHNNYYHRTTPRLNLGNVIREEDDRQYIECNDNHNLQVTGGDNETIHSGPDAAAGFGSAEGGGGGGEGILRSGSASRASSTSTHSPRQVRRRRDYNKFTDRDSTGLDTPGLIALSPIPIDEQDLDYGDGDDGDDEDDDNAATGLPLSNSSGQGLLFYHNNDRENSIYQEFSHNHKVSSMTISKDDQLKQIQQKLQKEILSHPQSIRSYCSSSHRKAVEMRQKEIDNSLIGVICPDCNNNTMTYQVEWYMEDRDININIGPKKRRRRAVYTCICQSSLSSRAEQYYNHHTHRHPPFHINLLQIVTSPVFQNVPLSIIFDLSIKSAQMGGMTLSASLSLTSSSISSILHLFIRCLHKAWSILTHTLNPYTLLDHLLSIQRKAMGISSEAIVTGIQSVATLGSDQKAMVANIGFGGTLTRDGGIGSVLSASVRSGSVAKSGLSDWWRGGGMGSSRGNLICEKVSDLFKSGYCFFFLLAFSSIDF
jgi:hypothetical protein